MKFIDWLYISLSLMVGLMIGYFSYSFIHPVPKIPTIQTDSVHVGKPDTTLTENYVEGSITKPAITEGKKKKATLRDSLITINVEYDTESDEIDISYIAKLTTSVIKQVDTVFVTRVFDMKEVPIPERLTFEAGIYVGIGIAVAVIVAVGYGVYKLMTVWK